MFFIFIWIVGLRPLTLLKAPTHCWNWSQSQQKAIRRFFFLHLNVKNCPILIPVRHSIKHSWWRSMQVQWRLKWCLNWDCVVLECIHLLLYEPCHSLQINKTCGFISCTQSRHAQNPQLTTMRCTWNWTGIMNPLEKCLIMENKGKVNMAWSGWGLHITPRQPARHRKITPPLTPVSASQSAQTQALML